MPDWEWWQWVLGVFLSGIGLLFGVMAFKIAVTFNVTDWLNRRDEKRKERIRLYCPHVEIDMIGEGKFQVKGLMFSPSGTTQAQCTQCGQVFIGGYEQGEELAQYYIRNPDVYFRKMKRFKKAMKKAYKYKL